MESKDGYAHECADHCPQNIRCLAVAACLKCIDGKSELETFSGPKLRGGVEEF